MRSPNSRLWALGLAIVLVLGQFVLFSQWIQSGQLPSRLAVHWGFSGAPDRFSDSASYLLAVTLGYSVLVLLLVFTGFFLRGRLLPPMLFGIASGVFGFLFLLFSISVILQRGRTAEDMILEPWLMLIVLAIPVALALLLLGQPKVTLGQRLSITVRGIRLASLDFEEITGLRSIELRARDYGGFGIRYAKKTLAFIPNAGPGLLVETSFGESIAIRSNSPQILESLISGKLGPK